MGTRAHFVIGWAVACAAAGGVLLPHPALDARATQVSPFFSTFQPADLLLSGYGFGKTGGPLRFNHPGGVAVVGGNLVLADRNNNRVLIWSRTPVSTEIPPDLVLGQASMFDNSPGTGLDGLNWPTAVATDGTRLFVADTYNDRILVWRTMPRRSRQPADYAITSAVRWPWGIWTDGRRLAVSSTISGSVLLWNQIPQSDLPPDLQLRIPEFGTPRAIVSDGTRFAVSDHNARVAGTNGPGNFFWRNYPASAQQAYSFLITAATAASTQPGPPPGGRAPQGEHFHQMLFAEDGRLLALGNRTLCVYREFPTSANTPCAVLVNGIDAGDNSGMALDDDGRLFVSLNNGNRVVVFDQIPESPGALPSFAIGSPSITTNTLVTDAIVTNPVPLTDGTRLWVSSDFDRTLHVWRTLPVVDGQKPDFTYRLGFAPWASARIGTGVALAGQETVAFWKNAPEGQPADVTLTRTIGSVSLSDLKGVAWDGTYFFLSSATAGRVWVWLGIPAATSEPIVTLQVERPGRISSDGRYLVVPSLVGGASVQIFDVRTLTSASTPWKVGTGAAGVRVNLPEHALVQGGALFVADTPNNRVLIWRDVASAISGAVPTAVLGAESLQVPKPAIGVDRLFWPGALAWDGTNLWVGEFKFSNRLVRFRVSSSQTPPLPET